MPHPGQGAETGYATGVPPLKARTKWLYGLGSVGYGIKDIAFRTFLVWYYNQVVGARADLVAGAVFVALVVDAISDPVVGHLSDRLRTRWGRRHPFMYAAALPASLSFLALWLPPNGLEGAGLFAYLVVVCSLVRTFITFYEIPSSALAPELAPGYQERTSIAAYRYSFGYVGYFGMYAAALFVFLRATDAYPVGQLNPDGYMAIGIAGSLVMFATILTSSLGTHERIRYLAIPEQPPREGLLDTFRHMGRTFNHGGFVAVLTFGVLKYTVIGIVSVLSLYFYTYFWGFSATQIGVLAFEGLVAAVLSLKLAPLVSRRYGKRTGAVVLSMIGVGAAVLPYLLRFAGLFFENGDPLLLPTYFVLQSVYLTSLAASAVMIHAMIGDLVDEQSVKTGRRAEGLFYAANSFMQKCTSGFGVFAAGLLLAVVGFPEGGRDAALASDTIGRLAAVYVPSVVVLYAVGASFLAFYHVDEAQHEATLAKLAERGGGLRPGVTASAESGETAEGGAPVPATGGAARGRRRGREGGDVTPIPAK